MDYRDIITMEPGKRSGKPCVRGLRIAVSDVLEYLASGMEVEEILRDFPELTADDVRACLAYAADRERRLTAPWREAAARSEPLPPPGRSSGRSLPRNTARGASGPGPRGRRPCLALCMQQRVCPCVQGRGLPTPGPARPRSGKFVYLRTGNCTSAHIRELLTSHAAELLASAADPGSSVLTLG